MEDLPIGSEITLKVVEDKKGECNGCFFHEFASDMYAETCTGFKCGSTERKDGKKCSIQKGEIIWKQRLI